MKERIFDFIIPKTYTLMVFMCLYSAIIGNVSGIVLSILMAILQTAIVVLLFIPEIKHDIYKKRNHICPSCNNNMVDAFDELPLNYCPYCGTRIRLIRKDIGKIYKRRLQILIDKKLINE